MNKKKQSTKIWHNSGGRTVWPRRLSFSPFVVLMSTTNGEKDSLLGQTVLPPELGQILGGLVFLWPPFMTWSENERKMKVFFCKIFRQQVGGWKLQRAIVEPILSVKYYRVSEIAKLLDFRSNPGLTSRVSELEIGSNNCPSGAFRSDPLETWSDNKKNSSFTRAVSEISRPGQWIFWLIVQHSTPNHYLKTTLLLVVFIMKTLLLVVFIMK